MALNARDAADRGAIIRTRTKVVGARRDGDLWTIRLENVRSGETEEVRARLLVNAAGPWVDHVLSATVGQNDVHNVRLVQGSHIVVGKKFDDPRAYFFQNKDGRIIFAIPYEQDFTLIGTTDRDYKGAPHQVKASSEEIAYLCAAASEYFKAPVTPEQVVWTYSGVRPLYDDGASKAQEATRDYVLELENGEGKPPLLSVFGGKITTYRRLAEHAIEKLSPHLAALAKPSWTRGAPLPGGDFAVDDQPRVVAQIQRAHPWIEEALARRLVRAYGTRALRLLDGLRSRADLGRVFGADLTEAEVRYLMREEWARTAADVLWRRSKLGLRLSPAEVEALDAFMAEELRPAARRAAQCPSNCRMSAARCRAPSISTTSRSSWSAAASMCCSARRWPARPR